MGFRGFPRSLSLLGVVVGLCGCVSQTTTVSHGKLSATSGSGTHSGGSSNFPPPVVTTSSRTTSVGGSVSVLASSGTPPYSYSVDGGARVSAAGVFQAPGVPGIYTVRVTDANGSWQEAQIRVDPTPRSPNDPKFANQWDLNMDYLHAPLAWGYKTDCSATLVGVLDSGVDYTHEDLNANIWTNPAPTQGDLHGYDFFAQQGSARSGDPKDVNFHGTHVSGIIGAAGNNSTGVSGVCWQARIVGLRFMGDFNITDPNTGVTSTEFSGATSDAVDAIDYAIAKGVKVLNNSWGYDADPGDTGNDNDTTALRGAFKRANAGGMLLTVAAGNGRCFARNSSGSCTDYRGADNSQYPEYPANIQEPNVIAVAAHDSAGHLASFSNFSATKVHIAAPGVQILSTLPSYQTTWMTKGGLPKMYGNLDGTSMATPVVTGAIALVWAANPTLTAAEMRARILDRADVSPDLSGKIQGARRLNLYNALMYRGP